MTDQDFKLAIDEPAIYRIELQGTLDRSWRDFLGGMEIQVRRGDAGQAVTTLTGRVVDQAALAGVLSLVYDLGLVLLSVTCLSKDSPSP